ncbi:hypothetical protein BASA50_008547 [Batrachochytrium salamandrivorans]|uniref:CID domain-containing protein n=1 Tax=Batrachochytrium salamandrivorans TaxID=1357716 RepID=A0ABQ8F3U7_9FUNG|nr:hypothetical protein BASA50_008547 [Batrachochytrium salamandrivorans]
MAFAEGALVTKLQHLSSTQQSIQVTSQWLQFHRKHARTCVAVWAQELAKASPSKRLGYIYLASDVIQNSKRKGEDFCKEFESILPAVFATTLCHLDLDTKSKIRRVVDIWRERGVYPSGFLDMLLKNSNISSERRPEPGGEHTAVSIHSNGDSILPELQQISSRLYDLKSIEGVRIASITSMNGLRTSTFYSSSNGVIPTATITESANAKKVMTEHLEMLTSEIAIRTQLVAELRALTDRHSTAVSDLQTQQECTFKRLRQLEAQMDTPPSPFTSNGTPSVSASGDSPHEPAGNGVDLSVSVSNVSEASSFAALSDSNASSLGSLSFGGFIKRR